MNARIQELAEQCRTQYRDGNGGYIEQFDEEKFAELIVRECINISTKIDKNPYIPDGDQAKKIVREIKKHFGVE